MTKHACTHGKLRDRHYLNKIYASTWNTLELRNKKRQKVVSWTAMKANSLDRRVKNLKTAIKSKFT